MALTLGLSLILVVIGLVILAVGTVMKNVQVVGGGALVAFVGLLV